MSEENQPDVPETEENAAEAQVEPSGGESDSVSPGVDENTRPTLPEGVVLPAEWTDEQIQQWLAKADPSKGFVNAAGVYLYDPTRNMRALGAWKTEELLAFMVGELQGVPPGKTSGIIAEFARRVNLEPAWSNTEILAFYRDGITPPKTPSGVWVNDVTRPLRRPGDWSTAELKACILGEIKPVGKNTLVMLARELHSRLKLGYVPDTPEAVAAKLKMMQAAEAQTASVADTVEAPTPSTQIKAVGALTAMNVGYIDDALKRYQEAVQPGKIVSEQTGAAAQRGLEALFQYVLKLDTPAMVDGLNRIKAFINANRTGVFSPDYAYRFIYGLKGDIKVQRRHVDFVELFLIVTDKNKAKRRQVDIRRMVSGQAPEKIDILVDYFTNHA